jgi:hypothetical protein
VGLDQGDVERRIGTSQVPCIGRTAKPTANDHDPAGGLRPGMARARHRQWETTNQAEYLSTCEYRHRTTPGPARLRTASQRQVSSMPYLKMRPSCTMDTNEPCAAPSSSGSALP